MADAPETVTPKESNVQALKLRPFEIQQALTNEVDRLRQIFSDLWISGWIAADTSTFANGSVLINFMFFRWRQPAEPLFDPEARRLVDEYLERVAGQTLNLQSGVITYYKNSSRRLYEVADESEDDLKQLIRLTAEASALIDKIYLEGGRPFVSVTHGDCSLSIGGWDPQLPWYECHEDDPQQLWIRYPVLPPRPTRRPGTLGK